MATHPPAASTPIPHGHRPGAAPAWLVPLLALPIRRLLDDPRRQVLPLVHAGSRILEVGPGTGFYSVPVARALGPEGRLVCVELQEPVRAGLQRRLAERGLAGRVEIRACAERDLGIQELAGTFDAVLAIAVVHEMPDPAGALAQMALALRPGGRLLLMEPRGHCPEALFQAECAWAVEAGLRPDPGVPAGGRGYRAVFQRPGTA